MTTTIRRFQDLVAWQKARAMTAEVYRVCETGRFARDFGLKDQIQRAAVSAMSNIAEGFERSSPNENLALLRVAKASCAEVRSQLYVALDIGYISEDQFVQLMGLAEEVGRLIAGLKSAVERYRDSH